MESLSCSGSLSFPQFFLKTPELHLMFICGSPHLLPFPTGWGLSEGRYIWEKKSTNNNLREWLLPMGCVLIWVSHWLAIPSISDLPLPMEAGHILGVCLVGGFQTSSLDCESRLSTGNSPFRIHIPQCYKSHLEPLQYTF